MTKRAGSQRQPALSMDSEVARQIRQHSRSSSKAEICGVLIGKDRDGLVEVTACITGLNAQEGGAHVTFTQDTWEHIYKVKDANYPDDRIVGWYHSHPGFGVFLSDHDTFIHKNFFSSPSQVAWVFDPHSDEEGGFGWVGGRIERLATVTFADKRGGERAEESGKPEPTVFNEPETEVNHGWPEQQLESEAAGRDSSLQHLVATFFSYLTAVLLGFVLAWYVFPRIVVMPVPVDPQTGMPLQGISPDPNSQHAGENAPQSGTRDRASQNNGAKENDAQPK